jgi:KaiC/GvpD/RAD55 family RecA-like ATPase
MTDIAATTVWLLTRDKEFIRQNAALNPAVFPKGELRYLAGLALRHWKEYQEVLNPKVFKLRLMTDDPKYLRRVGVDAKSVRRVYRELAQHGVPEVSLPATRVMCREHLEQRSFEWALTMAARQPTLKDGHQILEGARLRDEELRSISKLSVNEPDILQTLKVKRPGEVTTGIYALDNLWQGGTRPGELGICGAPTGIGKSMFLCQMAAAAFWQGKKILYYTFELTNEQIRGRVAFAALGKGEIDVHDTWEKELAKEAIARGVSQVGDFEARAGVMAWPELVADLEEYKRSKGQYPDLLILDSADDINPTHTEKRTFEQLKEAFTFLRQLAHKYNIAVWTSAQLNREAIEKSRVNLKHIGDALSKAQRAHYVVAFAQTPNQMVNKKAPEMTLYILKDSQYGSTGNVLSLLPKFGPGKSPEEGYAGYEVQRVYREGTPEKEPTN